MSVSKPPPGKILPVPELARVREAFRTTGKRVVQCHGCFDIVHPGHIRYLRFARAQGDVLIVSVTSDAHVGKGVDRPYISEQLRAENLAALEFVDYVCIDDNSWAGPVLEALRPDVYVKGREYETKQDARFATEKALVEEAGGQVVLSSGDVVYSSTFIIERFKERFALDQHKIEFYCKRHAIKRTAVFELLGDVANKRVLVVGEPLLECYEECEAQGIAADSPILSVSPVGQAWFLGSAAWVAQQMVALGASAALLTAVGEGLVCQRFRQRVEQAGVELVVEPMEGRPVFINRRFLVGDRKVFHVREGHGWPISTVVRGRLVQRFEQQVRQHDAVIFTDLGYGLYGPELLTMATDICQRIGRPYYLDVGPSGPSNLLTVRGPALATATESELRFALGDMSSGLSNIASRYLGATQAGVLYLTLGKRGALTFQPAPAPDQRLPTEYLPAFAGHALDTVGAGDAFLCGVALAHVGGASPALGMYLGNTIAGLQTSRLGLDPISLVDLSGWLETRPELR